jgi:hypothetical protein
MRRLFDNDSISSSYYTMHSNLNLNVFPSILYTLKLFKYQNYNYFSALLSCWFFFIIISVKNIKISLLFQYCWVKFQLKIQKYIYCFSIVELLVFLYHVIELRKDHCMTVDDGGPVPLCSVLIYNPFRRYEVGLFLIWFIIDWFVFNLFVV